MKIPAIYKPDSFLTAVVDGVTQTIRSSNSRFSQAVNAWRNNDLDALKMAINMGREVANQFNGYFKFNKVVVTGNAVKYGCHTLDGVIVDRILKFANEGLPFEPLVRFLDNLYLNPSASSVKQLYPFLENVGLVITDKGTILGYKAVQDDFWSKTGNKKTIVLKGKVDSGGKIYNGIGEEIEVARHCVVEDVEQGCAEGIHIGTYAYATGFGLNVILIEFEPKDAVSVPKDENFSKLRVCHYWVRAKCDGLLDKSSLYSVDNENKSVKPLKRDSKGRFASSD